MRKLKWDAHQVMEFLRVEFPQAFAGGQTYTIDHLEPGKVRVGFMAGEAELRPGGTVSGPALMQLVDFSIYVLLLAHHRESAAMTVTTNLQISFLRKADAGEIACHVELLKHGRTLSVASSRITQAETGKLIAHAETTYYMAEAGQT